MPGSSATPPFLSQDGLEVQFAVNHIAHTMVLEVLTPVLVKTSEKPFSDVRVVSLSSLSWKDYVKEGVALDELHTTQKGAVGGSRIRYA